LLYLTAQAVGVLLAVGVVAGLTGVASWAALRMPAVAAVSAVLCAALLAQLPVSAKELNRYRRGGKAVPAESLRSGCLSTKHDTVTSFFGWLRERLPSRVHYLYIGAPRLGADDFACVSFSLLPAIRTADPEAARYVVFAGAIPADWRRRLAQSGQRIELFAPNFGLARLR
jgi:hypothetical protein